MDGNGGFNNRRGVIKIYLRAVRVFRKFSALSRFPLPLLVAASSLLLGRLCRDRRIRVGSHGGSASSPRGERSTFPIFHETRGTCMTRPGVLLARVRRKVRPGKKVKTRDGKTAVARRTTQCPVCYAPEDTPKFSPLA